MNGISNPDEMPHIGISHNGPHFSINTIKDKLSNGNSSETIDCQP